MDKIRRMLRHLFTTRASAWKAFPVATRQAIQDTIGAGEVVHRAEVCVIIERSMDMAALWSGQSARERARELFALHRIWDTEENCGVLIYLNLADHKVEIVADRAPGRQIQGAEWEAICQAMTREFPQGRYHESIIPALEQLNELLHQRFPADGPRPDQLSNRPLII